MENSIRKPELLIPAGNLENLMIAVNYGADAVYIGGEEFGLRAKAKNFSLAQMRQGIEYAHAHQVKVYVTANIIAHNNDIERVKAYFEEIKQIAPDALIIADPGILMMAKQILPEMELHLSTQANNTNYMSLNFWYQQGVKRVVVARELSFNEIADIRQNISPEMDIEAFVHGAMCISYSGRCLLSNYMADRDANHGACSHPCRWKYHLVEETRPNQYMPVFENERGTFIYNSKDLNMIAYIDRLIQSGVNSLKIEGRMKTALYVATVTRAYRAAIDDFMTDPALYQANLAQYQTELTKCSHRQFTTGFYLNRPDQQGQIYDSNSYQRDYVFVAKLLDADQELAMVQNGLYLVEQRNKFELGDQVELMAGNETIEFLVERIETPTGESRSSAPHPKEKLYINLPVDGQANQIIRKKA